MICWASARGTRARTACHPGRASGDTVGLSIVHVNRVLRQLRECGAVSFKNGRVKIDDLEQLSLIAGFDPGYLHLEGPVRQAGVVEAERVDAS